MNSKIILKSQDLEGSLLKEDLIVLKEMDNLYAQAMEEFSLLEGQSNDTLKKDHEDNLIQLYNLMGKKMQELCSREERIKVYSFETPRLFHGQASRLIAKLRDPATQHDEFVYYIQRAYEMLFQLAFGSNDETKKHHLIIQTPVTQPVQNFAVHKIPDMDSQIENTVMCVMLRGALLPSMILSKEIQENSSTGYVSPFALFRIQRDDSKNEENMEYILDLKKSFFRLEDLEGKDLVFADPMNATGGSLVTIVRHLEGLNIRPRSILFLTVISALKGALTVVRALPNVTLYTLWMDPALNEMAYIMPGLGDAGDRLNGKDIEGYPRNMIQLLADYGSNIISLYRAQVQQIEKTVLP